MQIPAPAPVCSSGSFEVDPGTSVCTKLSQGSRLGVAARDHPQGACLTVSLPELKAQK